MQTGLKVYNQEEWYKLLLDDLKAIITESVFTSRIELIKGKWLFGERLVTDENYKKTPGEHKESFLKGIAVELNAHIKEIYRCVQFYEKYPNKTFDTVCQSLPEGKNISWHKLTNIYLPETSAKEQEIDENIETCNKCPKCGYEW